MDIRLHDTLTKDRKRVVPGPDGRVGMYVCGPTVYDRAHIGNARPAVVFDTLCRLLRHVAASGDSAVKSVYYVRNFTDVDDKILARAEEAGRPISEITEETTRWYLEDMGALGCLEPDAMPRATDYVNNPAHPVDMVRLIARLIETGHAYEAEGHVLFSVSSWDRYGTLSRRSTDELLAGARVDVAPYKRSPMDFVLWKPSEPHEPGWESPWGRGRPGWHIECSAMAEAILGRESGHRVQIHGGGIDLVFPHHENERAQSCCAFGVEDMADIWMHNGYLMVEGEKMSKSLGNFITVKDLRDRGVPGEVIRFVLLKTHYRQPLDWTEEAVVEATQTLAHWAKRLARYEPGELAGVGAEDVPGAVAEALADDLNTPNALAEISYLARKANPADPATGRALVASAALLGFDLLGLPAYEAELSKARQHRAGAEGVERAFETVEDRQIVRLLERRTEARKARDFATADRIRDGLAAAGVDIRDGPDGTTFARTEAFDPDKLDQLEADA